MRSGIHRLNSGYVPARQRFQGMGSVEHNIGCYSTMTTDAERMTSRMLCGGLHLPRCKATIDNRFGASEELPGIVIREVYKVLPGSYLVPRTEPDNNLRCIPVAGPGQCQSSL